MELSKYKKRGLRFLGYYFLASIASTLCKSIKIIIINDEHIKKLEQQNKNYVLAFWHGTMLIPWYLHSNRNFAALVSRSEDGDLLAKILENWDYKVVRGSSSKGGEDALKIMVDQAQDNYSVAITPDGRADSITEDRFVLPFETKMRYEDVGVCAHVVHFSFSMSDVLDELERNEANNDIRRIV